MSLSDFFFNFLELFGQLAGRQGLTVVVHFVPLENAAVFVLQKILHVYLVAARLLLEGLTLCDIYYVHLHIFTGLRWNLLAGLLSAEMGGRLHLYSSALCWTSDGDLGDFLVGFQMNFGE